MSVDDHGLEVLKKAAEEIVPGDKAEYILRVKVNGGTISGEFVAAGFKIAQKITTMNVTDTEIAIPSTPLSDRNSISIQNLSEVDTLYIGPTGVTADRVPGITSGWEVGPGESLNELVQDDITYYGITESGKTVMIKVREIA